ncbi:hypothetical protein NPIL_552031 [Nephila pilipes]|uniref:Uncharacterized protein n=1 Tax=Nephila pilipes TaxID=299642 RepID=A0A8X6PCB2_NEPPI|nr:hypothetical protein NPIL_552031 [Nephila pilipes]
MEIFKYINTEEAVTQRFSKTECQSRYPIPSTIVFEMSQALQVADVRNARGPSLLVEVFHLLGRGVIGNNFTLASTCCRETTLSLPQWCDTSNAF